MAGRLIWCLGMYASASTWLFNVVRQIHLARGDNDVQSHFVAGRANFGSINRLTATNLVKSHEINDEATVIDLAADADRIFVSVRDPRDAVASLMKYHGHEFDEALLLVDQSLQLCKGFAADRRTRLFRYETRFFEAPHTIKIIASDLDIELSENVCRTIFESLSRKAVEKYISALPQKPGILQNRASGDLLDPSTQWHTHHSGRNGEVGRWKTMLSEAQAHMVEGRLLKSVENVNFFEQK